MLKQVWLDGSRSEAGPVRKMTKSSFESPPMGTRSLPVVKNSSFRLSSVDMLFAISQNHLRGFTVRKDLKYSSDNTHLMRGVSFV